jgi:hypothetical protein
MIVEIYDTRLGRNRPNHTLPKNAHGITVVLADGTLPIAVPFGVARALAVKEPIDVLRILCHGNEGELELGKEEINFATVGNFKLLDGAFQKDALIVLYSCSTVKNLKPSIGRGSDPFLSAVMTYVKRIADIAKVPVMGSPELQYYSDHGLHFGDWEGGGGVYVITPAGTVVRVPALGSWHEDDLVLAGLRKNEIRLIKQERGGHWRSGEPFPADEPIWRGNRF